MSNMSELVSEMQGQLSIVKRYADLKVEQNIYGKLDSWKQSTLDDLELEVCVIRTELIKSLDRIKVNDIVNDEDEIEEDEIEESKPSLLSRIFRSVLHEVVPPDLHEKVGIKSERQDLVYPKTIYIS